MIANSGLSKLDLVIKQSLMKMKKENISKCAFKIMILLYFGPYRTFQK